jgi:hypothetical protein
LAVVAGEAEGETQPFAWVALEDDFAAVGADDALGDHETEAGAGFLGGEVGLEDAGHGFLGHAAAGVGEADVDPVGVGAGAIFVSLVAGLYPAWIASRTPPTLGIKGLPEAAPAS